MNVLTASHDELIALVPKIHWYHTIDLGNGLVTPGTYDHRPYLAAYGFPADMTGMKVLDVGRASGFFSFEFERRGADVLAVELPSPLQKDFVGGNFTRGIKAEERTDNEGGEHAEYGGRPDFMTAHRLLQSRVRSLYCSIYDLSPEKTSGETFDLVFLGSILNHLAHPIAALTAVRGVTKSTLVVANPFEPERRQSNPVAHFVGRNARSLTNWWIPTIACMQEMLIASGFADVRLVARNLSLKMRTGSISPHFVMHAAVQQSDEAWRHIARTAPKGYRRFWPRRVAGAVARKLGLRRP
jgi:tRNA (mo5U34)-methyltransferase